MPQVSARRLRIRAPPGWAARTQARVEDALRLAAPDDRLLLVRRLDLGRLPLAATPSDWSRAAAERLAALASRAVHGGAPGAGDAVCVWFRAAAEARRLLLAELAAGRLPAAWFWRLAVPGWRGLALAGWLPLLIAEAEAAPERAVELAAAVVALLRVAPPGGIVAVLLAARAAFPAASGPSLPALPTPRQAAAAAADARARRLLLHYAPAEQVALRAVLARLPPDEPAVQWLACMVVLDAAPELAAQATALAATAAALVRLALPRREPVPVPPASQPAEAPVVLADALASPARAPLAAVAANAAPPVAAIGTSLPPATTPEPAPNRPAGRPAERFSAGAGLWLLIRPLEHMGVRPWLHRRPTFAADGFPRALLCHIASRMRLPTDDPLFVVLAGEPLASRAAEAWDPALTAWRIGADRWLRRRVGRRLADVVTRRGWLTRHEAGLEVRFRADAADPRIRRRALDVDPGWVPWLGLAVRYHYCDARPE